MKNRLRPAPCAPLPGQGLTGAPPQAPRRARGFSLLEVLVAIFVLSFGMLGMVGMQAFALQSNTQARLQSSAAALARELAEMMRGNKDEGLKAAGANPYLGTFSGSAMAPATTSYCLNATATTNCTSTTDVANAEMTDWLTRVGQELPGARVSICYDNAPYDSSGLPVWTCSGTGTDGLIMIKMGWTQTSTNRSKTGESAFNLSGATGSRPALVFPVTSGNS